MSIEKAKSEREHTVALWRVHCMENKYPGMWQRWFRNQCVGVGWCAAWGYSLHGATQNHGWARARAALLRVKVGDYVVATLSGHRVGRLGRVTGLAVGDDEWNPLVPRRTQLPDGEMGRRLLVRWDMTVGPEDREVVVHLPEGFRFTGGELNGTITKIRSINVDAFKRQMDDPENWVSLVSYFDYERALSGYIAAYPYRLEDGLTQHPDIKVREKVYKDRRRSDVVLLDRKEITVIVECKQSSPQVKDIEQLRHYLSRFENEEGLTARGMLVHGGARKLRQDVARAAAKKPSIEVIQHRLQVDFAH